MGKAEHILSQRILFDGRDAATGEAKLGPVSPVAAGRSILRRWQAGQERELAPPAATPKGFPEGWGLVCRPEFAPNLREALDRLVGARGGEVYPYHGEQDSYTWLQNLQDENVPLPGSCMFLLLAGSPKEISFGFQKMLTPQHLVGRLCLPDAAAYGRYVEGLLDYETGKVKTRRTDVEFYGPDDTPETQASRHELVEPLMQRVAGMHDLHSLGRLGAEATWEGVVARLGVYRDAGAPAITFLVSHGAEMSGNLRARYQGSWIPQGAPALGADPSPDEVERHYVTGGLYASGELSPCGSIVFNYSCFGAGLHQEFTLRQWILEGDVAADDPGPSVSALGQALLSNPRPALAYVSTLDRKSNVFSLLPGGVKPFQRWLELVLAGVEVGQACQVLWEQASTLKEGHERLLTRAIQANQTPETLPEEDAWALGINWIMGYELENVVLMGDPAARLRPPYMAGGDEYE